MTVSNLLLVLFASLMSVFVIIIFFMMFFIFLFAKNRYMENASSGQVVSKKRKKQVKHKRKKSKSIRVNSSIKIREPTSKSIGSTKASPKRNKAKPRPVPVLSNEIDPREESYSTVMPENICITADSMICADNHDTLISDEQHEQFDVDTDYDCETDYIESDYDGIDDIDQKASEGLLDTEKGSEQAVSDEKDNKTGFLAGLFNNKAGGKVMAKLNELKNARQKDKARKEAIKKQQNFELFDLELDGEFDADEKPSDAKGWIKYQWDNNMPFRFGAVAISSVIVISLIVFGFNARKNYNLSNDPTEVAEDSMQNTQMIVAPADESSGVTEDEPELSSAIDRLDGTDNPGGSNPLDGIELTLPEELLPEDAKQELQAERELQNLLAVEGAQAEAANLAAMIEQEQSRVGEVPTTYSGSTTSTQPSSSIATLSIPSINLVDAPVMPSVELSDLAIGTGHFPNTPMFDGNVGIAGHNSTHFKYLVNLNVGDEINYTVDGVTRTYQVIDIRTISDTEWGVFTYTSDNRLTLVTCEPLAPSRRIAVIATQVGSDSGSSVQTADSSTGSGWGSSSSGNGSLGPNGSNPGYHDTGYSDYFNIFTGGY